MAKGAFGEGGMGRIISLHVDARWDARPCKGQNFERREVRRQEGVLLEFFAPGQKRYQSGGRGYKLAKGTGSFHCILSMVRPSSCRIGRLLCRALRFIRATILTVDHCIMC